MAHLRDEIPHLHQQPPAVDFIDNDLGNHHSMFVNPRARYSYDNQLSQYIPNGVPQINIETGIFEHSHPNGPLLGTHNGEEVSLAVRPAFRNPKAMKFWNDLFPEAMAKFRSRSDAPKSLSQTPFNIREMADWESVYDTLAAAKDQYCQKRGTRGSIRRFWHRVEDNITPVAETAKIASNAAPDNTFSTPILGVLVVILDAIGAAATARARALEDLDSLVPHLSDIEVYTEIHPEDENVWLASLDLVVAIFDAVEQGVKFFVDNAISKAGKAVFMGDKYQQTMISSLETVNTKAATLKSEAEKSDMYRRCMESKQQQRDQKVANEKQDFVLSGINNIFNLLNEHEKERIQREKLMQSQLLEQKYEIEQARVKIKYLEANHRDYSQRLGTCMSQEALRRIIGTGSIDIEDSVAVSRMQAYFPLRERAQAEQLTQSLQFRRWLVSPTSAKLLFQWDPRPSKSVAYTSPLSLVCGMITTAFEAQSRFIPLIWFGGREVDRTENGLQSGPCVMIRSLIEQLLRHYEFDTQKLPDIAGFSSLENLNNLFAWLVSQLPATRTLCCIVDGVVFLEREEYAAEAIPVLLNLVNLASNTGIAAPVKILFTTISTTMDIRGAFEEDGLIINVETLPRPWSTPSEARMIRELGTGTTDE